LRNTPVTATGKETAIVHVDLQTDGPAEILTSAVTGILEAQAAIMTVLTRAGEDLDRAPHLLAAAERCEWLIRYVAAARHRSPGQIVQLIDDSIAAGTPPEVAAQIDWGTAAPPPRRRGHYRGDGRPNGGGLT
jgi:hypothetical protein